MTPDPPGYRLVRMLGRGGSGEVWLASAHGPVERLVAVKRVAEPGAAAASFVEASLAGALDHPHLVRLLDAVDDPPGVALVMPYLAGGSLRGLLGHRGTLTAGEVVALLEPVAAAVGSLHRHGLVHGDLKPDNVLLTAEGEPMLADVGLARLIGAVAPGLRVAGTPAYLDPVVAEGGAPGPRSEVFSLGVIAYEALTARLPHRGEPAEVVAAAGAGAHRRLYSWPSIPTGVAELVELALSPDPGVRPADGASFVALFRSVVPHDDISLPGPCPAPSGVAVADAARHRTVLLAAPRPPPPTPTDRSCRSYLPDWAITATTSALVRRALAVAALAGVVVGLVGLVGLTTRTHPRNGPKLPAAPCPSPSPAPPGSGVVVGVDVDGDGCVERTRWAHRQLRADTTAGAVAFAFGRPGDRLLVGDWDGDGSVTVALYRPAEGVVLYVDRFPPQVGDRAAASRLGHVVRHGRARVVTAPNGPDRVLVAGPGTPSGPMRPQH